MGQIPIGKLQTRLFQQRPQQRHRGSSGIPSPVHKATRFSGPLRDSTGTVLEEVTALNTRTFLGRDVGVHVCLCVHMCVYCTGSIYGPESSWSLGTG
jgi:hypothetical protein